MTKRKLFDEIKEGMDYLQKVREAPYHPGYEDAVVIERRSEPVYKGLDVRKMLWKSKPLTDEQIIGIRMTTEGDLLAFARAIEERHGIK